MIDGRTIGEDGVWVPNEGDTEPANSMDLENGYLVQNLEGLQRKITRSLLPVRQPLDPAGEMRSA